jgi:uncharacterized protein YcaQ
MLTLSSEEARHLMLHAQGLDGPSPGAGVADVLTRLGAIQLDTISVLARSHELVAFARLGPVPRATIEQAYWGAPARSFEYIGHSGSILPLELWPAFAFRRRALLRRGHGLAPSPALDEVRARLREGPVTASDLGGARSAAGWWNWSGTKVVLEALYRTGEAAITVRRGWKRVYDLPERVIPPALLAEELSDEECYVRLVEVAARALGVGTLRDIADYFRLSVSWAGVSSRHRELLRAAVEAAGLVPAAVEGWREPAFTHPAALAGPRTAPTRTTLLSPFDSLAWATTQPGEGRERERLRRTFGFSYSLEAYVPQHARVHGYFVMPLLARGRLAGRVDPARRGSTLVARRVSLEDPTALEEMAAALIEAAAWVGCDAIEVQEVAPAQLAGSLRRLVS